MRNITLLVIFCTAAACGDKGAAEQEAAKYAEAMYPGKPHTQSCVARDTDGDDYVSCTLVIDGGPPIALECAGRWTMNEGCKVPQPKILAPRSAQ